MNYVWSFNQKVITYSERLLNMQQGRSGLMVFRRISIFTNSFSLATEKQYQASPIIKT